MVKVNFYPECCTAVVLTGFGKNSASISGDEERLTKEEIQHHVDQQRTRGNATVTLITNSKQKKANKFLRELGFSYSPWMKKPKHSETKIRIWWLALHN